MFNHVSTAGKGSCDIDRAGSTLPVAIPPGHVGEFVIPGTGRKVWWTGRVAIGLRHQPVRSLDATSQSSMWLQRLMLDASRVAPSV